MVIKLKLGSLTEKRLLTLELIISPLSPMFCKGSEGVYCRAPAPDCTLMLFGKAFVRTKPRSRGNVLPKGY